MVIDDDPWVRTLVSEVLQDAGYEALTAENGQEALDSLSRGPIQLVILDLSMPVMGGREFFREFRARGHIEPVLLLSASAASEARWELGADGSLDKPFDIGVLIERVRSLTAA